MNLLLKYNYQLRRKTGNFISEAILKNYSGSSFISATPIVLFESNKDNKYFSFKQSSNFNFFFERLKDNAIKKYNAFYNDDFYLESNLFTNFEFSREVSIRINKEDKQFIIIGSLWKNLEFNLTNKNKKFYRFIFENGLGEKNSLGFGFLNCRK